MQKMGPVEGGEIWTEDSEGVGTPVILLHPGWGDSTIWRRVVKRLPQGLRVISYDSRGYGHSPAPTSPFAEFADLIAITEALAVTEATAVGHSGGAAMAICLAIAQPKRVQSLILIAPGVSDYPWPPDDVYLGRFDALYSSGDHDGLIDLGRRTWAVEGGLDAEAQIRSGVAGMFNQEEHLLSDTPAFDRLRELTMPTCLLIGSRDHPSVIDCAAAMAERIPGCRTFKVAGADHMLPLRRPDLVAHIITDALPHSG
jgi:pimeloyl-ACP methyl ester carboxylesterase